MALVEDVIMLITAGFQVYRGEVPESAYAHLKCFRSDMARWFRRNRNYVCLGCGRRCSVADPEGFQLCLDLPVRHKKVAYFFDDPPAIPDRQLLENKELLHPDEAAAILRVNRPPLKALIDAGTIGPVRIRNSLRVRSEDVRKVLANGALNND